MADVRARGAWPDAAVPPAPAWTGGSQAEPDWAAPYRYPGPGGTGPPPPQGTPPRLTGGAVAALVGGGVVLFVVGVVVGAVLLSALGDAGGLAPGATAYGPDSPVEQFALAVGDCGDGLPEEGGSWPSEAWVACSDEHDFEVYAVAPLPTVAGEGYPNPEVLSYHADSLCDFAFEPFVGVDYYDSVLYYTALFPGEAAWAAGDRDVLCALYDPAERLVGSARGSGW